MGETRTRQALNLFRCGTKDGALDKKYLRVCSVYRLLKTKTINKARALELLAERHTGAEMKILRGTVDLWFAHPLKEIMAEQKLSHV